MYEEVFDRFWSKATIGSADECWPWTKAHSKKGYGRFKLNGKMVTSSRLSLAIKLNLPIEKIINACHTCDNPPCINPNHLFHGTGVDNMADCSNKGRLPQQNGYIDNSRKITCKKGHLYSVFGRRPSGTCSECDRQSQREYRAKKKLAAVAQK